MLQEKLIKEMPYEKATVEIVYFNNTDVITTSTPDNVDDGDDWL